MTEQRIELIQLENGDLVLRPAESSDQALMTLSFSERLSDSLEGLELTIANAMVQAGIECFQDIQASKVEQASAANASGMLH